MITTRFRIPLACALFLATSPVSAEVSPEPSAKSSRSAEDAAPDPRRDARELVDSPLSLSSQEKLLIERPDRDRPQHPITLPVFGRPLTLGGRYNVLTRYDRSKLLDFDYFDFDNKDIDGDLDEDEIEDFARGNTPRDDQLRVNQSLQLDLFYPFTPNASAYAEFKLFWRNIVWAENTEESDEWLVERGELWFYLGELFETPLGLQVGRQNYFDDREWWWDEDLDSIRVRFDLNRFHAEVAVAQEVLPVVLNDTGIEPDERDIVQILGMAQWRWGQKQEIGLYALHQRDHSSQQPLIALGPPDPDLPCVPEDEIPPNLPDEAKEFFRSGCPDPIPPVGFEDDSDSQLTWLGVSAAGTRKVRGWGRFDYWLEAAGVIGKERFTDYSGPTGSRIVDTIDKHDVSGWGLDIGGIWELSIWARPYLALGYAIGSGDSNMQETSDSGFRQTGLQDNSDKLHGVSSFNYYGELLDPELSNLRILTAGFGLRFLRRSSIDFLYHKYRQVERAPFLRDVNFKRDPDGRDPDIGQEWDMIVGIEDFQPLEFKFVGSVFRPGRAFRPEDGELSYLLTLRVRLNF